MVAIYIIKEEKVKEQMLHQPKFR